MIADKENPPIMFRDRLKFIIAEQKIGQAEFAKSLGISANYVYLLTSGKKTNVSEPLARLIESTYGYSAKWLLTGEGDGLMMPRTKESLKSEILQRIRTLPPRELKAVAVFLNTLEEMKD